MKILVTGCAGFIGSHCCEKLLAEGHELIGIDNFSRFYAKSTKLQNMQSFRHHENFTFHEVDLRDKDALHQCLNREVDLVLHLAAKAGVRPSIEQPADYIDVNVKGTQHLLDWMVQTGCKKLFFASSSSVYGNNPDGAALSENAVVDQPISPYAFSKRSAELMNYTYHHLYQLDVINARFFTVYGPRQRPDLAIHKFVKLIDQGHAIEMYGDGASARDYTFVADTVDGVYKAINYLQEHSGIYETLNLGNQTPVTLSELIGMIYTTMQKEANIIRKPMQAGDVNVTHASIDKAKSLLGYNPQTSMSEGIRRFYDWFLTQKNDSN